MWRPTPSSSTTRRATGSHGLGEIVTALLDAGMEITMLVEHDSVPWNALPGKMRLDGAASGGSPTTRSGLPLTYTLQAVKRR